MVSDRNRKIQDRAYEIWVESGRQDGTSDRNWAQAEQEVGHHDQSATAHPTTPASEPISKSAGKTTTKSDEAGDAKPAKSKAPKDKPAKDKAAKAAPEKGKKAAKAKAEAEDSKPRSKK